jgi:hypothetical protein
MGRARRSQLDTRQGFCEHARLAYFLRLSVPHRTCSTGSTAEPEERSPAAVLAPAGNELQTMATEHPTGHEIPPSHSTHIVERNTSQVPENNRRRYAPLDTLMKGAPQRFSVAPALLPVLPQYENAISWLVAEPGPGPEPERTAERAQTAPAREPVSLASRATARRSLPGSRTASVRGWNRC